MGSIRSLPRFNFNQAVISYLLFFSFMFLFLLFFLFFFSSVQRSCLFSFGIRFACFLFFVYINTSKNYPLVFLKYLSFKNTKKHWNSKWDVSALNLFLLCCTLYFMALNETFFTDLHDHFLCYSFREPHFIIFLVHYSKKICPSRQKIKNNVQKRFNLTTILENTKKKIVNLCGIHISDRLLELKYPILTPLRAFMKYFLNYLPPNFERKIIRKKSQGPTKIFQSVLPSFTGKFDPRSSKHLPQATQYFC